MKDGLPILKVRCAEDRWQHVRIDFFFFKPDMATKAWNLGTEETGRNTLASSKPVLVTQ